MKGLNVTFSNISVGLLNVFLNIFVLLLAAFGGFLISQTCRNLALARLTGPTRRAPIVHDSDHFITNMPFAIYKYRKYPGILFVICISSFLIVSEIVAELGVGVSDTCGTKPVHSDRAICPGNLTVGSTPIENSGTAFFLQSIKFLDGNFTRVGAHVRRELDGTECFSCMTGEAYPDIASGCSTRRLPEIPAGKVRISALTTQGSFGTKAQRFVDLESEVKVNYTGWGDLTHTGNNAAMFMVSTKLREPSSASSSLTMLEYGDSAHVLSIWEEAKNPNNSRKLVEDVTRAATQVYQVECDVNKLDIKTFATALRIFRTTQFEAVARSVGRDSNGHFLGMTSHDVYKAILAFELTDDRFCSADTLVYRECGSYEVRFLSPLITCLALIVALRLWSGYLTRGEDLQIPHNSATWFSRARRLDRGGGTSSEHTGRRKARGIDDELVLVEEKDGSLHIRINELDRGEPMLQILSRKISGRSRSPGVSTEDLAQPAEYDTVN